MKSHAYLLFWGKRSPSDADLTGLSGVICFAADSLGRSIYEVVNEKYNEPKTA